MRKKTLSPLQQVLLAGIFGILLFALGLAGLLIGFHITYIDRIYPGVRVGWVDVSGLTIEEATNLLVSEFDYPLRGQITLWDGDQTWTTTPSQV